MRAINHSRRNTVLTTLVEPHGEWTYLTEPNLIDTDVELVAEQWMQNLASIAHTGTDTFSRWNHRWTINGIACDLSLWLTFLIFIGEPQLTTADHWIRHTIKTLEEAITVFVIGYEG